MSNLIYFYKTLFLSVIFSLFLSACGGGGDTAGNSTLSAVGVTDASSENTVTLSGSVGDGPITGATVSIRNSSGQIVTSVVSDQFAKYSVDLDVDKDDYPLTIEATGGIDLVTAAAPDFILYSVALDPSVKRVHINPFTTMIVKTAEFMPGGLSKANVETAKSHTLAKLNFGLDSRLLPDPISSPISETNIAVMVKASETLGEMVRRTRDRLNNGKSADDVILDLAEDLTDGLLDGTGANGAIPQTSAIAHLISAQVLLEALSNDLKVGGTSATKRMDDSITDTMPGISTSARTGKVVITDQMIAQAVRAINNAVSVNKGTSLANIAHRVARLSADTAASDITAFQSNKLDSVILAASSNRSQTPPPAQAKPVSKPVTTPVVKPVNNRPVIGGRPSTLVMEKSPYRFAPSYSDKDGDQLTFSISSKPRWASFNTRTGVLAGTPSTQDAQNYPSIRIRVSDGKASTYLPSFSITVVNLNRSPSITGTPATTVLADKPYSFVPLAKDADGDKLTFKITSKPAWATFNTRTGALTGTPSVSDIGNIARRINISVSDGIVNKSLASFDIKVLDNGNTPVANNGGGGGGNGSASLNWVAPTENTDNSVLTDLAGFKIYYGTTSGDYPNSIDISNPSISSYIIDNLPLGTYYFVIAAYTANGIASGYSNEASKVVN